MLRRLRDVIRRKCSEKGRTNSWFVLHDNAPAHRSVLVNDFSAKNNATTLDQPPYFFLFPRMKSVLKGLLFFFATHIKKEKEELKTLLQNGFKECFHQLYSS
jgi:hypothetical protein